MAAPSEKASQPRTEGLEYCRRVENLAVRVTSVMVAEGGVLPRNSVQELPVLGLGKMGANARALFISCMLYVYRCCGMLWIEFSRSFQLRGHDRLHTRDFWACLSQSCRARRHKDACPLGLKAVCGSEASALDLTVSVCFQAGGVSKWCTVRQTLAYELLRLGRHVVLHNGRLCCESNCRTLRQGDSLSIRPRLRGGASYGPQGSGAFDPDSKIPAWDGSPETFIKFKEAIAWWLEGENLDFYVKNNVSLAARFVRRETGPAKTRALKFKPEDLRGV